MFSVRLLDAGHIMKMVSFLREMFKFNIIESKMAGRTSFLN